MVGVAEFSVPKGVTGQKRYRCFEKREGLVRSGYILSEDLLKFTTMRMSLICL